MEWVIRFAITEMLLKPLTDDHLVIRRYGYVMAIEQAMHVGSQEKPITDSMRTICGEWNYVRRFESRKRMFPCRRASARISLRYRDPESPLP